jgi:hypothetical protein
MEENGRFPLDVSIPPIVSARRRRRGVLRHLLRGDQVDAEIHRLPIWRSRDPRLAPRPSTSDRSAHHWD